MHLRTKDGYILINEKTVAGKEIRIVGNLVLVDGVVHEGIILGRAPVRVTVTGNCDFVTTGAGNITVGGSVLQATSSLGDVHCGAITGNATTTYGDIYCSEVAGSTSSAKGSGTAGKNGTLEITSPPVCVSGEALREWLRDEMSVDLPEEAVLVLLPRPGYGHASGESRYFCEIDLDTPLTIEQLWEKRITKEGSSHYVGIYADDAVAAAVGAGELVGNWFWLYHKW